MAQIVAVPVGTEVALGKTPFIPLQPVAAYAAAAATLYGVDHPGTNALRQGQYLNDGDPKTVGIGAENGDTVKYLRLSLSAGTQAGSDVTFDSADFPALANADTAAVTDANRLRVVVRVMGTGNRVLSVLNRVTAAADPGAGEFKTSGSTVLTIGEVLVTDGTEIEVWMLDADDIASYSVTANLPNEVLAHGVVSSAGSEVRLERLAG
jgi:hypothetical protein